MDSRQLHYFAAIYEQRTLSSAAQVCNVAPSALSHHLANMEAEFDTPLFVRRPRGMVPTAAGERLYEHAKLILRAMSAAEKDLRTGREELSGEIAIGMAYSAVKAIGLPLLRTVLDRYPKLRLSLSESLSGATLAHLLAADVDLALVYNPPAERQLVIEPVLEEDMFCVGRRDIIGDTDAPIAFVDLLELPMILLRRGLSSRALVDDAGLLAKLEGRAVLQMNSVHAIASALVDGLGCAIGTKLFMREHLESGALRARPIVEPALARTLYLCRLRDSSITYAMEAMRTLMLTLIAEEVRAGNWQARLVTAQPGQEA